VATKAAAVNFMVEKDADVNNDEGKLWAFMKGTVPRIFRVRRTYVTVSPLDECVSLSSDKDNVKSVPLDS
jgi:chorismate-pyruvate lyase